MAECERCGGSGLTMAVVCGCCGEPPVRVQRIVSHECMTTEYSKAYAKGYQAGMKRSWPQHRAPLPPDKIREDIMKAANDLRDAADDICARLDESDDFVKELSPKIDALDKANRALVDWCVSPPEMANDKAQPRPESGH